MRHIVVTTALIFTGIVGCATTKQAEPLASCKDLVQKWAGQDPVQGMPQPDGGIIFVKPRLDGAHHLFVMISKMNEGKVMQDVKQNTKSEVKVGQCIHPANGYPYTTLEFTVAPQLQSVGK